MRWLFALLLFAAPVEAAQFRYATQDEAVDILTSEKGGAYFSLMGQADPTVRLKAKQEKGIDALKAAYAKDVRAFSAQEKRLLDSILADEVDNLAQLAPMLPDEVLLIATKSVVEGGLPHTRANAIVFPEGALTSSDQNPRKLFWHELFHVISRHNQDRHDSLYSLIGFSPCDFDEPEPYAGRRLTNPDAPINRHYISLVGKNGPTDAIPMLYTRSLKFAGDPSKVTFAQQFRFGFIAVTVEDGVCTAINGRDGTPVVLRPPEVDGFFQQIGGNTDYIIHPEEVLADNFALMMIGEAPRDQWVLDSLAQWLGVTPDIGALTILSD